MIRRRLTCLFRGHVPALVGVPDDHDVQCRRCGRLLSPKSNK